VWMMGKKLKEQIIKSWNAFCVDLVYGFNPRTKERKCLITHYKTYGIITLKKHVNAYHSIIAKNFEKRIYNGITKSVEK
jgi:hypothetical protein